MKPGSIPISDAKEIGSKRGCSVVVMFGIEQGNETFCVTTWGKTRPLCAWAAKIGDDIHKAVMEGDVCDAQHAENPYERIKRLEAALRGIRREFGHKSINNGTSTLAMFVDAAMSDDREWARNALNEV